MWGQFVMYMEKDKIISYKQKTTPGLIVLNAKELNYKTFFFNVGEHFYNPREGEDFFNKMQKTN